MLGLLEQKGLFPGTGSGNVHDLPGPVGLVCVGVDPGASGGLAVIGPLETGAVSMPGTDADVWGWFNAHGRVVTPSYYSLFAVIEKVGGHVGGGPVCPTCKQPGNRSPGSSMFKFGRSAGGLAMACVGNGIPVEEVPPQRWQSGLHIAKKVKSESRVDWKNRLKGISQRLFPSIKVTLATADALLIATYCMRWRTGTL